MVENNKFKVIESDGHNDDTVHVFRSETHFLDWFKGQWGHSDEWDDMMDQWSQNRSIQDPNCDSWEEFDSLYEVQHGGDLPVKGGYEDGTLDHPDVCPECGSSGDDIPTNTCHICDREGEDSEEDEEEDEDS